MSIHRPPTIRVPHFLLSIVLLISSFTTLTSALPTTASLNQRSDPTNRNDILNNIPCRPVTVIFARGTVEPGNVGLLAGPPFFSALSALLPPSTLAVQGVPYPASVLGYLEGGDPNGATKMASLTSTIATRCPSTQIVLSGYSQGAQVVHLAARQLSVGVAAKIRAVVLFGDPDEGQEGDFSGKGIDTGDVVTFCFEGDLICDGAPIVLPAHLAYAADAGSAADFVMEKVDL